MNLHSHQNFKKNGPLPRVHHAFLAIKNKANHAGAAA
jgi:hypothetical protein